MHKILNNIHSSVYSIMNSIHNVIRWIPIIWKDRDFDQTYLFDIMIFKLSTMEKFFNKYAISVDAHICANDIHRLKEMIEYIRNEQYEEDGMKPYYDKYPIEIKTYYSDENNQLFMECDTNCEKLYQSKMKEIYNLFTNKVRNWWD